MLVLSRKVSQGFFLGDDIRITVVKADRNSVRIGIEAPAGVAIRREEIIAPARPRAVRAAVRTSAARGRAA